MNSTRLLIGTTIFICSHIGYAQASTFSPEGCEFVIDFPQGYETRDVHSNGRTTKLAVSETYAWGQLSAECFQSKQPTNISAFAMGLEDQIRESGFTPINVTSRQGKYGPIVLLLASTVVQGKKYNLALETHFGKSSRMDAKVVQVELLGVLQDERFRRSVKLK
jgi:hypothetical protein